MKNLTSKKVLTILTYCLLIIIPLLTTLGLYLFKYNLIQHPELLNLGADFLIVLPFLVFIYISDIKIKKRKLDFYDYLLYALILASIISVCFSINKNIALFGKEHRYEGFFTVITYYFLFINWKVNGTKEDIKKLTKLIYIIAIANSILGIFQVYTSFDFIVTKQEPRAMAFGFCGHFNFFGSLIVTALAILTTKVLYNNKISKKDISLLVLFFISLINSQSTGPFVSYFVFLIFIIVFLLIKKSLNKRNLLALFIIIITTFICVNIANTINYKYNKKWVELQNEFSLKRLDKTFFDGGTGRLKIWKNSIHMVENHPIVGIGFDNYYLVYPENDLTYTIVLNINTDGLVYKNEFENKKIVDNAHNVYLHTLVITGILGFILYMFLIISTLIHGIKSNNKYIYPILGGFVAYSIQAFTNISVVQVAPIYYILIGLILSEKVKN